MKTRKRFIHDYDGMCKMFESHMDKMINDIYRDCTRLKINDFNLMEMDHEMRRIRYGVGKKMSKCSATEFNDNIHKYFDKAIKSGQRIDEACSMMGNKDTDYEQSIHNIVKEYTKLNKGSFKF